jgi:hypothetical protein
MEFKFHFFYALDKPITIVLLSLGRTEYYFSLRVQYGKLKTNIGKQS